MKPKVTKLKTLILAAHASELAPFIAMGRKYRIVKKDVAFLAAGVGPVAATFGLTHFLEDHRPEQIIAVGTAGIIATNKFKIGDVVIAKSVSTSSGFIATYAPKIQKTKITPTTNPKLKRGLNFARVYCPQEITRDENWRQMLLKTGHEIEHLEAFAFALVAQKFKIPLHIFLGLANNVGPDAHLEWLKFNKDANLAVHSQARTFLKI